MTIKDQILFMIRHQKPGWAFSAKDFIQNFKRADVDVALSSLKKEGTIRRIIRGIYDVPMYSNILDEKVGPDLNQVARAISRRNNWKVFLEGNMALNHLGLSTQMVAKYIYLSDGPTKTFDIDGTLLEFKKIQNKDIIISDKNAALVVQSLRALGKPQMTDAFIKQLSKKFTSSEWEKIQKVTAATSDWIFNIIKQATELAKWNKNG